MKTTTKQLVISGVVITAIAVALISSKEQAPDHCFQKCVIENTETIGELSLTDWRCVACMYDYEIKQMPDKKYIIKYEKNEINFLDETIEKLNTEIRKRTAEEYKLNINASENEITRERYSLSREIFLQKAEKVNPAELVKMFK